MRRALLKNLIAMNERELGVARKAALPSNVHEGGFINPLTGKVYRDSDGIILQRKRQKYNEIQLNQAGNGSSYFFPDDSDLNELPVYALEFLSSNWGGYVPDPTGTAIGAGAGASLPLVPNNFVNTPFGRDSGVQTWGLPDVFAGFLSIKSKSTSLLVDGLHCSNFLRSLNNGYIYKFDQPLDHITWSTSFVKFYNGYVLSLQGGTSEVPAFTPLVIPYIVYYYGRP
jgi:hypothetical protein